MKDSWSFTTGMPPPSGRRERRRERTRRALLESALSLFSERGIYATRLEDITQRADLGKGAFYNYFESKDSLVAELLSEATSILLSRNLGAVEGLPTIAERVASLARQHAIFFHENPSYLPLFHQARGLLQLHRAAASHLTQVFAGYLAQLGRLLVPPGDERRFTEEDRVDLAAALAGAITGYRSFRIASGLGTGRRTVEEMLERGLPSVMELRARA
jgi:AcrR family transcriptional regulator